VVGHGDGEAAAASVAERDAGSDVHGLVVTHARQHKQRQLGFFDLQRWVLA
jgi:hypothetical protein